MTDRGTVMVWAHLLSQQWDVYAPGFRSLQQNEEYVESETEFDLNPKGEQAPARQLDLTCKVHNHFMVPFKHSVEQYLRCFLAAKMLRFG